MSSPTVSEMLFEAHCESRSVRIRKIPESTTREPDYELFLRHGSVFAEIKQLDPNERDLSRELLTECQEKGMGLAPVERVRGMIASGYAQLKRYVKLGHPGILVAYNNAGLINYIDEFTVTKAMFGAPFLSFGLDPKGVIRWTGQGFGGGRRVTRNSCRALSALCVLEADGPDVSRLHVYHNPYATVPLDPIHIAPGADYQYVYNDPHGSKNPRLTARPLEV